MVAPTRSHSRQHQAHEGDGEDHALGTLGAGLGALGHGLIVRMAVVAVVPPSCPLGGGRHTAAVLPEKDHDRSGARRPGSAASVLWSSMDGRIRALARHGDALLAAGLAVFGVVAVHLQQRTDAHLSSSSLVGDALVLALAAPLAWRRRAPRLTAALVSIAAVAIWAWPGPDITVVPGLVVFYGLGRDVPRPQSLRTFAALATGIESVALALSLFDLANNPWSTFVARLVVVPCAYGFGDAVRRARERDDAAHRERAERDAADRLAAERQAAAHERSRIARELHDVVAHSLSVMVVQATLAERVAPSDPQRAAQAMANVVDVGRAAMGDMRRILGVLDGEARPADLEPQPVLADLRPLVDRCRAAGLPVTLEEHGVADSVPAGVELSVIRIVQEALTNVLKHTDRAPTTVRIAYGDPIRIDVENAAPLIVCATTSRAPSGIGRGLVGMRERVDALHGSMTAGPTPAGGFRVQACLPIGGEQP